MRTLIGLLEHCPVRIVMQDLPPDLRRQLLCIIGNDAKKTLTLFKGLDDEMLGVHILRITNALHFNRSPNKPTSLSITKKVV